MSRRKSRHSLIHQAPHLKLLEKVKNVNETTQQSVVSKIIDYFFNNPKQKSKSSCGPANKNDMNVIYEGTPSYSLSNCSKAHHHEGFFPVSELRLEDLPVGFRSYQLLNYIKDGFSPFVVKVIARHTSSRRIASEKYDLAEIQNSKISRQGTGWASRTHDDDNPEVIPCPRSNCRFGDDPHDVVGPIYIMTARHVVFDQSEASQTEILFTDPYSTWTAEGVDISYTPDKDRDFVYIKCYSHDMKIFSHLRSITDNMYQKAMELLDADIKSPSDKECVFIISHPHDRAQYISFGVVTDADEIHVESDSESGKKVRGRVMYTYDVPTCPGSSGAPVCIMGTDGAYYYQFPHSLGGAGDRGMNSGLVDWIEN